MNIVLTHPPPKIFMSKYRVWQGFRLFWVLRGDEKSTESVLYDFFDSIRMLNSPTFCEILLTENIFIRFSGRKRPKILEKPGFFQNFR